MKNISNKITSVISFCILLFTFTTTSCINDHVIDETKYNGNSSDHIVKITLKVNQEKMQTRSLSEKDTYKIDLRQLKVLLFKDNKFIDDCKVDIIKSKAKVGVNGAYDVFISVPEEEDNVEFYFFANTDFETPQKEISKEDLIKNIVFNVPNNGWNTIDGDLLPMWGTTSTIKLEDIINKKTELAVTMIRSLARIDVVKNEESNISLKYTIKGFYIYNSNKSGVVAPFEKNYNITDKKVSAPSILDKTLHNSNYYFDYTNHDAFIGKNGIAFIPEQKMSTQKKDNITLILKAAINNKDSYYRIDLHKKNEKGSYIPTDILRNHRYIVNIKDIIGLGKDSVEEAAAGPSSNINVDIIEWNENINNGFVSGSIYFGINSNKVRFKDTTQGQVLDIDFKTNLTNSQITDIEKAIRWENNLDAFDVNFDIENSKIHIKTKTENTTNNPIIDTLILKNNTYEIRIEIYQPSPSPNYTFICDNTKIEGLYHVNRPLSESNKITLEIMSDEDLTGYTYELETEEIDNISFSGTGIINSQERNGKYYAYVIMNGKGTPLSKLEKVFTIKSNSGLSSTCIAYIQMTYSPKFILALDKDNNIGTVMGKNVSNRDTESSAFRTSKYNFGLEPYSIIKIPQIEELDLDSRGRISAVLTRAQLKRRSAFYQDRSKGSALEKALNGTTYGYKPDIVILGGSYTINKSSARGLVKYLDNGGCLLCMQGSKGSIKKLFKALYKNEGEDSSIINNIQSKEDAKKGSRYQLVNHANDPVYNGPFGNLNGMFWGDYTSDTDVVTGIPERDIIVYSYNVPDGMEESWASRGVTMFRHVNYNIIFVSNDDFISNPGGDTTKTKYPFLIDRNNQFPIAKLFGSIWEGYKPTHNSIIFANMFAYLIDQAEFHGINSNR